MNESERVRIKGIYVGEDGNCTVRDSATYLS